MSAMRLLHPVRPAAGLLAEITPLTPRRVVHAHRDLAYRQGTVGGKRQSTRMGRRTSRGTQRILPETALLQQHMPIRNHLLPCSQSRIIRLCHGGSAAAMQSPTFQYHPFSVHGSIITKRKKRSDILRNITCCASLLTTQSRPEAETGLKEDPLFDSHLYAEKEIIRFGYSKNPTQLEKSIEAYLKSHPEPTEGALLSMLAACAGLMKTAVPSPSSTPASSTSTTTTATEPNTFSRKGKKNRDNTVAANELRSNLFQTILASSAFTPDDVFNIARSIYYNISTGRATDSPSSVRDPQVNHLHPSLQVTNAFLHVCAVSGHFDEAWLVIQDMMQRRRGDVKPDLATYRNVLKSAAVDRWRGRHYLTASNEEWESKVDEIIDYATESLSRQSRIAFWMKMGLGGLAGATVAKFTTMGVMALPGSGFMTQVTRAGDAVGSAGEGSHTNATTAASTAHHELVMDPAWTTIEGMIHSLASQEVAMGVGLAAGLLTASYVIRASTRQLVTEDAGGVHGVESTDRVSKVRNQPQHHRHYNSQDGKDMLLPRARLFGLYFPELATTKKTEIRGYLRKCAGAVRQ